jgi:signal transduction histidine kinase
MKALVILLLNTLFFSQMALAQDSLQTIKINKARMAMGDYATASDIPATSWQEVTLPFRYIDTAKQTYLWFELNTKEVKSSPLTGIYIAHHAFDFEIFANSQLIASQKSSTEHNFSGWNSPFYTETPVFSTTEKPDQLIIKLKMGLPNSHLSSVTIGDPTIVKAQWNLRYLIQVKTAEWTLISTLLLGLFTLFLWLRRRQDTQYLLFSGVCAAWGTALLYLVIYSSPIPHDIWLRITYLLVDITGLFLFCFVNREMEFQHQKQEKALIGLTVLWAILYAILPSHLIHHLSIVAPIIIFAFILHALVKTYHIAITQKIATAIYISAGTSIALLLTLWDLFNFYVAYSTANIIPEYTLMQHSFFFLLLSFFFILVRRFVNTLTDFEDLNLTLEKRVSDIALRLEQSFEETRVLELKHSADLERQKIMRDLHDDVGAKLVSILHTKKSSDQTILARDALSSMRGLVSQSFESKADLATIMATCAKEMELRLLSAEIKLESNGIDTLPKSVMDTNNSYHIHRILREVVTNIIKHAKAKKVVVSYAFDQSFKCIIEDNGTGFDNNLPGSGLKNIEYRANQIGAEVNWLSSDKGTIFTMTLDIQ